MSNTYKREEFEAFIKTIEDGAVEHWIDIARALNVDPDTITAWKRTPEGQEAIKKGIKKAFVQMEKAGAKDWKMWDRKLQMLGVNPAQRVEVAVSDPVEATLKKLGLMDAGENKGTEEKTS